MTAARTGFVTIGPGPTGVGDLVRIADGSPVALAPETVARILASRAVVDVHVAGPALVYGLNTGLGHMRDVRLPVDELVAYQDAIVAMHAGAIGPPLDRRIVRAAMAVRLVGIGRGGSGASLGVAEALLGLLNAGVVPVVPETGSVGASDLMHMAAIGEVLLGRGRAEYDGRAMPGGEALRAAGLTPLALAPKDGLALISANGVSVGRAALVATRAAAIAELADVVVVASLEAVRGNPSIVDPAVAAAKGIAGQTLAADRMRALLAGSTRCVEGAAASVQDPLSFRVAPQVHGALREAIGAATAATAAELAASDDNPLVSIADGRLISNGNFHPIVLALAFDALRPALVHVGQLCERRMNHLWSATFAREESLSLAALARLTSLTHGPLLRYAAAAEYARLRALAGPATLDVSPLDLGVEDHATNAPETVRLTDEALDLLEDLLLIELLMARTVVVLDDASDGLGAGARAAFGWLAGIVEATPGASPPETLAELRSGLATGLLPSIRAAARAA